MKVPELTWPVADSVTYDDDLLLDVLSGSIVLLVRGRNAWHSTWVRHYLRNATLYSDVSSAKGGAESQRGQGNVFYVVEAPALQLRGALSNVVLCDAHPDDPFGRFTGLDGVVHPHADGDWVGGLFPGVSVRDAVAAFAHDSGLWAAPVPNEHSLRRGRLEADQVIRRTRRPLESLVSVAQGSNNYLGWRPRTVGNRYARRGANGVARRWNRWLSEANAVDGTDTHRAARLAEYRDEVLCAVPRSVWSRRRADRMAQQREAMLQAHYAAVEAELRAMSVRRELAAARQELQAAEAARLHPAETSAGIRAQRERVEKAREKVHALEASWAEATAEASDG